MPPPIGVAPTTVGEPWNRTGVTVAGANGVITSTGGVPGTTGLTGSVRAPSGLAVTVVTNPDVSCADRVVEVAGMVAPSDEATRELVSGTVVPEAGDWAGERSAFESGDGVGGWHPHCQELAPWKHLSRPPLPGSPSPRCLSWDEAGRLLQAGCASLQWTRADREPHVREVQQPHQAGSVPKATA